MMDLMFVRFCGSIGVKDGEEPLAVLRWGVCNVVYTFLRCFCVVEFLPLHDSHSISQYLFLRFL